MINDLVSSRENAKNALAEIARLADEIERMRAGYQRIIDSSDSEMRDGDLAREIAEAMLRTDADAKSR